MVMSMWCPRCGFGNGHADACPLRPSDPPLKHPSYIEGMYFIRIRAVDENGLVSLDERISHN